MSLDVLYVLLGKVSVQVLCPFFNWVFCLPRVESCEFFIYFGDQTLVQGIIVCLGLFCVVEVLNMFLQHPNNLLNSASDRLFISTLFSSFSGVLFCSFIWAVIFVSSFWQNECLCLDTGRAALTPFVMWPIVEKCTHKLDGAQL